MRPCAGGIVGSHGETSLGVSERKPSPNRPPPSARLLGRSGAGFVLERRDALRCGIHEERLGLHELRDESGAARESILSFGDRSRADPLEFTR